MNIWSARDRESGKNRDFTGCIHIYTHTHTHTRGRESSSRERRRNRPGRGDPEGWARAALALTSGEKRDSNLSPTQFRARVLSPYSGAYCARSGWTLRAIKLKCVWQLRQSACAFFRRMLGGGGYIANRRICGFVSALGEGGIVWFMVVLF